MKKLIILSLILLSETVFAGMWTLSVKAELLEKNDKIKKSVLKFSNRSGYTWTYTPPAYPFGFYDHKETAVGGKAYIVTFWSAGARSVYYRVFQPDEVESAVCEFETETESPKFRSNAGKLEYLDIYYVQGKTKTTTWRECLPLVKAGDKGLASVPAAAPKKIQKIKSRK